MKENQLLEIKTSAIKEEAGFNTRYDLGDLREIISNMKRNGFDASQPLIVRNNPDKAGMYILGAQGHRRLASAIEAGLDTVFAIMEQANLSDSDRNLDIVRLNSGEPLPMLAVSRVVKRELVNPEMTQGAIAKLLGKSAMFITNCVKLSKTTDQTQKWIEKDRISATEVLDIVDEFGAKTDEDFVKVEAKIEKLLAKAGEKKFTKKTSKNEEETDEEKAEREQAEREEAEAKAAQKSRTKELIAGEKRIDAFVKAATEGFAKIDDDTDAFTVSTMELLVTIAAMLKATPMSAAFEFVTEGEVTKQSDINQALKNLSKVHKETVKEIKQEAKEEVKATKEEVKATKEEAAKRIKAAKAAIASA